MNNESKIMKIIYYTGNKDVFDELKADIETYNKEHI